MTESDNGYARKLSENLKGFSERLEDDDQRNLLAGILKVAHHLKDRSTSNGNEPSSLRSEFKNAFDPLPADKARMLLQYTADDNPSMIVYSEPVATRDAPTESDPEQEV